MTVRLYSTTPASNNAAPPNGWPEGQAASTVNDCARQLMAEVRETFEEAPYFDFGNTPTRIDNTNFSVTTDLTARYAVGCRVKLVGATTGYGRITVSVFGAVTTVTVVMDSGNVPTSLVRVAVTPVSTIGTSTIVNLTVTNINGVAAPAAANPTASLGLSAVNGSATTFMRSDGAPALSQSITPTWSALHTFTKSFASTSPTILMSAAIPAIQWNETGAAADNKRWFLGPISEQYVLLTRNDVDGGGATVMAVDRTGTVIDSVAFPTEAAGGVGGLFRVGTVNAAAGLANTLANIRTSTASNAAMVLRNVSSGTTTEWIQNEATSGDNVFSTFVTEAGAGTSRGNIDFNRAGVAVRYNTTSDERLKTRIRDSGSALEPVMSLPVQAFEWIETGYQVQHGFVAQRLHAVYPDAVSSHQDPEKIWAVDPSKLVPLLTKALQETIARCDSLEQLLVALGTRLAKIEGRA